LYVSSGVRGSVDALGRPSTGLARPQCGPAKRAALAIIRIAFIPVEMS
jgi:hypothetical protein